MAGPDNQALYFGGGTPSILSVSEIEAFVGQAAALFDLDPAAEITLEANPDDLKGRQNKGARRVFGKSVERGHTIF